ncbi:NUMOD4 domain-containing protein [Mycolicibacterium phlei]|uniref:NUMOD4 domain-containing protein n=1 Tax=Mycolicibacterium phlei TaxID=1771 RepID=UPI0009DB0C1D|nr:NUMOD4 domain-containing protein [Mycolicibacterium phlei]
MSTSYPKTGEWAPIPGCDGYEASSAGDIRRSGSKQLLKQSVASNGAAKVNIGNSSRMVRDLIARTFFGRPLIKGYRVINLNGDPMDNRADNLAWSGQPDRSEHAKRQAPTVPIEVVEAYERNEADRLSLIELMQS